MNIEISANFTHMHMLYCVDIFLTFVLMGGRSVSLKSDVGLPYLSVMTSVYPASNGDKAVAKVGHQ